MRTSFALSSLLFFNIGAVIAGAGCCAGQTSSAPKVGPDWEVRPYDGGTLIAPRPHMGRLAGGAGIHTDLFICIPKLNPDSKPQAKGPPYTGYNYNTPASIACIYAQVTPSAGCDPYKVTENASGGSRVIAIVDPYDAPNITADLANFSAQFDLPAPTNTNFEVVYVSGSTPPYDSGWEREISLDVEAAHALAPGAKIILVEAVSNEPADLLAAVDKAGQLVSAAGGGEVSMSWIGGETATEISDDSHFMTDGVVYLGCSGDGDGPLWPSVSSHIVSVGGTAIVRDAAGAFTGETAWLDEGVGPSKYIPRPAYQNAISGIVHDKRGVPDVVADAYIGTGLWAYDSNFGGEFNGWFSASGTSVATPIVTGIINRAGHFHRSSVEQLTAMYNDLGNANDYYDVTTGICGPNHMYSAGPGWDYCSGVGSPRGIGGK